MTLSHALIVLALQGVPRHLRESVQGDLLEQRAGLRDALALVLHFQAEPYRDGTDRRNATLLLLAAWGLLWTVPMASHSLLAQAAVFDDGFSRAVLQLWRPPGLLAAVACGLLIGRASLLPRHADAARGHLVLLLMPVAGLAAPEPAHAVISASLLPAAAWLAHQNRLASPDHPAEPA